MSSFSLRLLAQKMCYLAEYPLRTSRISLYITAV
nr:MAG TPA: hypothetical protein [Bacteriophage sp.]